MEEVPASPEIVKRKKVRRKHGSSFSRLSFQQSSSVCNESNQTADGAARAGAPETTEGRGNSAQPPIAGDRNTQLSAFYFDDSSARIETVNVNPLSSAILLEKANAVPVRTRVPSPDFIAATNEQFLSAAELAKRNATINQPAAGELADSELAKSKKKKDYSFTQLDVDSQMINTFEVAELLACSSAQPVVTEVEEKNTGHPSPRKLSSLETRVFQNPSTSRTLLGPALEPNSVEAILADFTEDDGFCWEVDYSLIKAESLRKRLRQLEDYIASPPKSVKKEATRRQYGKRRTKESIFRRLSYETDSSTREEHRLTDDESAVASPGRDSAESDEDISMDGVALNESVLIQANLTQLSAFFSQAIASQHSSGEQQPMGDETKSLDREPSFHGFSPEPPQSPISLAPNDARSPRTLRLDFNQSFPSSAESSCSEATVEPSPIVTRPAAAKCPQIEQLLEDDEELFMLAHPTEEKFVSSLPESGFKKPNQAPNAPAGVLLSFSTARGSTINVSEAALLKAGQMFAEEEAKLLQDSKNGLRGDEAGAAWKPEDGSRKSRPTTVHSTETEEPLLPPVVSDLKEVDHKNTQCFVGTKPVKGINDQPKQEPMVGFSTAGGTTIGISKEALAKAASMFAEEEAKAENEVPLEGKETKVEASVKKLNRTSVVAPDVPLFAGGFSTAGGSTISVSKKALARAQQMFDEEESKVNTVNHSEKVSPVGGGFSTAGGSTISVSKQALARAQQMFDEEESALPRGNPAAKDLPAGGGFSTAGGSSITVSKEALARAQRMFDEPESNVNSGNLSEKAAPAGVAGFSTTRGSTIAISKKALEKARLIFAEEESLIIGKENRSGNAPPTVGGFSTASGSSKITVSKQSLERAQRMMLNEEEESMDVEQMPANNVVPPVAGGFSTASGSAIPVSEQALERARCLFDEAEAEAKADIDGKGASAELPCWEKEQKSDNRPVLDGVPPHRKRKTSSSQEELTTPTKRPRVNLLQFAMDLKTSTPAGVMPYGACHKPSKASDPKQPSSVPEVERFFAELDDEEFVELFRNQQQKHPHQPQLELGTKKQNKLLAKFEECAEETKSIEATVGSNTSTSHWDDSFSELLPKLASSEQGKPVAIRPPEYVQRQRREELQKQRAFVYAKPEEMRRPRVSDFCSKKLRTDRMKVEEFVGGARPEPMPMGTNPAMNVTFANVMEFRFRMSDHYGDDVCLTNTTGIPIGSDGEALLVMDPHSTVGVEEMKACFLASLGVDPRLVPPGWVENGWRWIVTKLGALERNLSDYFRGALTPENVFYQLQYRYHVEIDQARRSPLRKMLERDDVASRRMVLFVANVLPLPGTVADYELELSDGWYAIRAAIDAPLVAAVRAGTIAIGTKLMVQGGELLNHKDGCSPLEVPPEVRLRVHANSTRRVRWAVKLGYYRCPRPFLTPCNSILGRGGLISRLRAVVVRVYPLVYVEKLASASAPGGSVLRSERMQQRHARRNDMSQLDDLHKLYSEIQQEIERERTVACLNRNVRVTEHTPCSQLQELLESGLDVSFLDTELTLSQQQLIQRFQQQRQEELQLEINRRVKAQMDKRCSRTSVTSLLKVRLMDGQTPDRVFVLSIWRPSDDARFIMQEQNFLELSTITANGTKNGDVQLTAHKGSIYTKLTVPPDGLGPVGRFFRCVTCIGDIDPASFRPPFNEFDTVGVVVRVGTPGPKHFQSIYLADTAMELLCVNFWHGLAEYVYDDVVREGVILCLANLQWRTTSRQNRAIPQSFATEYTTCTENPRSDEQRDQWNRLQLQLDAIDREDFFQRCQERVRELGDTPVAVATPSNTCSSTHPTTPHQQRCVAAQTSTPVAGSIAKRKMQTLASVYGSPPKLSPIVMRSNPVLRKGFKTPARLQDDRTERTERNVDASIG